jgi:hypothetical protein
MPKRVIDFDALWASDKLAACAEWAQAEYAWFYGLADASGSFELTNLRVIWGRVAAVRKNLSLERLEQVFDEFRDKGLLFVWEENGKRYAHWTGSDAPGRLPPPSWRNRLEKLAPPVPRGQLAKHLGAFSRSAVPPRAHSAPLGDSMREPGGESRDATPHNVTRVRLTELKAGLEPPQAQEGDLERDWKGEREEDEERAGRDAREIPASQILLSVNSAFPEEENKTKRDSSAPAGPQNDSVVGAEAATRIHTEAAPWTGAHELLAIYTEERGALPEARELTAERSMKCAERLRAAGTEDAPEFLREFREAVRRAARTPFLCGANGRNWRATFDWLIANDENYRKVLEGRYDAFTRAPFVGEAAGLSQRDSYVQRELRVGLGPPGPHGVKPEALERDRLRREAERAAALAKNGGAKYCVGSARALAARPR